MDTDLFLDEIFEGPAKTLPEAYQRHCMVIDGHRLKLGIFSNEMARCTELRKVTSRLQDEFEERRRHIQDVINDNVRKMRRQQFSIKENRRLCGIGRSELTDIVTNTKIALKRREGLQRKLSRLYVYETFVNRAVKLLPKNYIRSKANAADSLIARFEVLEHMNRAMFEELYTRQEMTQRNHKSLMSEQLYWTEQILNKCGEVHTLSSLQGKELEREQQTLEQYERDRDKTTEECIWFFTVIRAVRNIAEKAGLALGNLQTHPIPTQHKAPLQSNFRLIMKFVDTARSIRGEISPIRKTKSLLDGRRSPNSPPSLTTVGSAVSIGSQTGQTSKQANIPVVTFHQPSFKSQRSFNLI